MGEVANGTALESFHMSIPSGVWGQSLVLDITQVNSGNTTQHTYQSKQITLNGNDYSTSNVFVQPTTYVIRDPRYGLGEVDFEYVYRPVIDF